MTIIDTKLHIITDRSVIYNMKRAPCQGLAGRFFHAWRWESSCAPPHLCSVADREGEGSVLHEVDHSSNDEALEVVKGKRKLTPSNLHAGRRGSCILGTQMPLCSCFHHHRGGQRYLRGYHLVGTLPIHLGYRYHRQIAFDYGAAIEIHMIGEHGRVKGTAV